MVMRLADEFRSSPGGSDTVIIALTATAFDQDREESSI